MTGFIQGCPEDLWYTYDSREATLDGWDLFEVDGLMEIERDDDKSTFVDDLTAINHVVERALAGDRLALKALFLHGRKCGESILMPGALENP